MALSTDLREIQITSASTSTITVSGLSFAPKLVLFSWTRANANDSITTGTTGTRGFGALASSQWGIEFASTDNRTANSQAGTAMRSDACIVEGNTAGGNISGYLAGALTSDGYTLTVTDATANSFLVTALAFGGTSIEAVVGSRACPTSAGDFSTTVTGITPNVVLLGYGGSRHTTDNAWNSTGGGVFALGVGTSSSNRYTIVTGEDTGASTTQSRALVDTAKIARYYNGATLESSLEFVSTGASAFTLNKSGSDNSRASRLYYVAIQVDQAWVGTFTTATSTGTTTVTSPGFQGQAILAFARPDATATEGSQATGATVNEMTVGLATSASSRMTTWSGTVGGLTTATNATESYNYRNNAMFLTDVTRSAANTASKEGWVDFNGFTSTGFTIDQEDADAQATLVVGMVLGETETGIPISWRLRAMQVLLERPRLLVSQWQQATLGRLAATWPLSLVGPTAGTVGQIARPIADVALGTWTTQSGGTTNLYATLDEDTPDDADYVRSAIDASNDVLRVSLTALNEPLEGPGTLKIRHRRG